MDFVKYLLSLGTGGTIAAIIFAVYRKDVQSMTALWKTQTEMLVDVVKDNTASNTRLITVIESWTRERRGDR